MPKQARHKTDYPGVYYIIGTRVGTGKPERIYYVQYRREGKLVEEKAGRQFQNAMTPARAATLRAQRIDGKDLPNEARREAEKTAKEAEASRWTITRLFEEYKVHHPRRKDSNNDKSRFDNFLKPEFGNKIPEEIPPLDVDRFRLRLGKTVNERTKRPLSPSTVRNILELLRRIVNFGVKLDLTRGLRAKVILPKTNNLRTEDLTPEQMSDLLTALDNELIDPAAADMMRLALYTGMRKSEIFKLQWKDVDFSRGFIAIRNPKGGKDQTIPLSEAAKNLLSNRPRTDPTHIFPARRGGPRVDAKKSFDRIKKAANLPDDFRPMHGLRHTFASMLASSGEVDLYTLQRLLTHKSPLMTQRYAHLRDETLKRGADLAGKIVQAAWEKVKERSEKENAQK